MEVDFEAGFNLLTAEEDAADTADADIVSPADPDFVAAMAALSDDGPGDAGPMLVCEDLEAAMEQVGPRRRHDRLNKSRKSKFEKCVAKRVACFARKYSAVRQQWNKMHGLRSGDCLQPIDKLLVERKHKRKGEKRPHNNRWEFKSAIRFAFRSMKPPAHRKGSGVRIGRIGHSERGLEAMSSVLQLHEKGTSICQ